MSFSPTAFRPLARSGGDYWRGALSVGGPLPMGHIVFPQTLVGSFWGQIGTVVYRSQGVTKNNILNGVTRDSAGNPIGLCRVELYLTGNDMPVATTMSSAGGGFIFYNPGSGPFYIVAYKAGSPDVAGTTVNTLTTAPGFLFLDFSTGSLPAGVTFTRATSGTRFNSSGVMVSETANVPRFNYSYAVPGLISGLLIEPAATNLALHTATTDLNNFNTSGAFSLTLTGATAPDGSASGRGTWATAFTSSYATFAAQGASNVINSCWLKEVSGGTGLQLFQPSNASRDAVTPTTAWAQYTATPTQTSSSGAGAGYVGLFSSNAVMIADTCFIQSEVGTVPTSFIPTTTATASRAADMATFTIPVGISGLRYTFDNYSTQDVSVSPGDYTIPTNLNRANILSIVGA